MTRALQLDILLSGLRDPDTLAPLAGGTVYFYAAGTTTPKNVWSEKAKTNAYTSVTLDANGSLANPYYGDGWYKIVVKDSDGNTEYTWDQCYFQSNAFSVVTKVGTYTATPDDDVIICSGTFTLNLQTVSNFEHPITVVPTSGSSITVEPYGDETISGETNITVTTPIILFADTTGGTWRSGYTGLTAEDIPFLQSGTGATERTSQEKMRDVVDARDYGVTANVSDDQTSSLNAAIAACAFTGGSARLNLPPGVIRCDGQILVDLDGIVVSGQGRSVNQIAGGTTLDLRYSAAHKILIGNGSTTRASVEFRDLHIDGNNGGNTYVFESRKLRGLHFKNVTFNGIFGFLKAGRSGETTTYISFDGIEGNMKESGSPVHEHFIDAVNVPGMVFFSGHGHVEGYSTIPSGSCFLNFGTTSESPDGIQIGTWTIRQFDRFFNFRSGVYNTHLTGTIMDFCSYGVYADTDVGPISGLNITGCHIAGSAAAKSAESYGISISQTTGAAEAVQVVANKIRDFGRNAVWLEGAMDAAVVGNSAIDVCQQTDATYSAFRIGANITGSVTGNTSKASAANQPAYGFLIESTEDDLIVTGNVSIGHTAGGVSNANRGSAGRRAIRMNTGQSHLGKYIVGPWTIENADANVGGEPMWFAMAGGSISTEHFRAIRRGRITGISVSSNAAVSAGELAASASINGTPSALTATLTSINQRVVATSADGIAFDAGDSISVRYETNGAWAPATSEILAFLEIVDD